MTSCLESTLERFGLLSMFQDKNGVFHTFLFWNVIAALAHLLNAILSYTEATEVARTNMYPVFQDITGWQYKTDFCANATGNEIGYFRDEFAILPTESGKSQELSLFWLIIGFHLLSFSFQISLNTDWLKDYYVESVLNNGVNAVRFIEYSISASIMVLCLAIIGNILSLYALIGLGCLTAVTQLFGLLAECLFSDQFLTEEIIIDEETPSGPIFQRATFRQSEIRGVQKVRKPDKPIRREKTKVSTTLRQLGWFAHVSGWVSMISAYVGILVQNYFWSVSQNSDNNVSPPSWVTALIITLAILYNIFGFTQLAQMCCKDPYCNSVTGRKDRCKFPGVMDDGSGDGKRIMCTCCGRVTLNEAVELCYVLNSLTTKTVLGWTIIQNLMREESVITTNLKC